MTMAAEDGRRLAGLVLAAGGARRFGAPKQLVLVGGRSLVETAAQLALDCCAAGVVVVSGAHAPAVEAAIGHLPVTVARNEAWQEGLASSLRRGVQAMPAHAEACLVLLCDQAAITAADLMRLVEAWQAFPQRMAAAGYAGTAGVPAIFPRAIWPALARLRGDQGARRLLAGAAALTVVAMPNAAVDVDTPADHADLCRSSGHPALPAAQPAVYLRAARQEAGMEGAEGMMRVRVEYFAVLREHAGCSHEEVETQAATLRALFAELEARHGFPRLPSLKVALNAEFRDWESPLADGDTVVFIPPVAGG